MSKLQRIVDSQIIQFVALPKIFNSMSADLPSGSILINKQTNEYAYWRLSRSLSELKKNGKAIREVAGRLAQALKAMVASDAFLNHYGLSKAPQMPSDDALTSHFRELLYTNYARVNYSSTSYAKGKQLLQTIEMPLGSLVFFHAVHGAEEPTRTAGIKGKLWLTENLDDAAAYDFVIASPFVKLSNYIGEQRLKDEIAAKLKNNLPALAPKPLLKFNDGQFDDFIGRGLQELAAKHQHPNNGQAKKPKKDKKKAPEASEQGGTQLANAFNALANGKNSAGRGLLKTSTPLDDFAYVDSNELHEFKQTGKGVLGDFLIPADDFEKLTVEQKGTYLAAVADKIGDAKKFTFIKLVLESGIMEEAWRDAQVAMPHARYLAMNIMCLSVEETKAVLGDWESEEEAAAEVAAEIRALNASVVDYSTMSEKDQILHMRNVTEAISDEQIAQLSETAKATYLTKMNYLDPKPEDNEPVAADAVEVDPANLAVNGDLDDADFRPDPFTVLSAEAFDELNVEDGQVYIDSVAALAKNPANFDTIRAVLETCILAAVVETYNTLVAPGTVMSYDTFMTRILMDLPIDVVYDIVGVIEEDEKPSVKMTLVEIVERLEQVATAVSSDEVTDVVARILEGNDALFFVVSKEEFDQLPPAAKATYFKHAGEAAMNPANYQLIRDLFASGILKAEWDQFASIQPVGHGWSYERYVGVNMLFLSETLVNDIVFNDTQAGAPLETPADTLLASVAQAFAAPVAEEAPVESEVAFKFSDETQTAEVQAALDAFPVADIPASWPAAVVPADVEVFGAKGEIGEPGEVGETGGEEVVVAGPVPGQKYTVVSGDTLWGISERAYGDGNLWTTIHLANKDKIAEPDLIYPNQVFVIPVLSDAAAV